MKFRTFFLLLLLLLCPARVQASDLVKQGSSIIFSLRQLTDARSDLLPSDILNHVSQNIFHLESSGVWLHREEDKRWVSFTELLACLGPFRDAPSPASGSKTSWDKGKIHEVLIGKVSDNWKKALPGLMAGKEDPHKAYVAAFLAYYIINLETSWELTITITKVAACEAGYTGGSPRAAERVGQNSAQQAAWSAARDAAKIAARNPALEAAYQAASRAAYQAAWQAGYRFVKPATVQKVADLAARPSSKKIGQASFDLAETFTLVWLIQNAHVYYKLAIDAAYALVPDGLRLKEAQKIIDATMVVTEQQQSIHSITLRDNIKAVKIELTEAAIRKED